MLDYASWTKERHNEVETQLEMLVALIDKHTAENKRIKNKLLEIAVNSVESADPDKKKKNTDEEIALARKYW